MGARDHHGHGRRQCGSAVVGSRLRRSPALREGASDETASAISPDIVAAVSRSHSPQSLQRHLTARPIVGKRSGGCSVGESQSSFHWCNGIIAEQLKGEILSAAFAVCFLLFVHDAAYNRLGSSNGKFISFVDTFLSVMSYRLGLPEFWPEIPQGMKRAGAGCILARAGCVICVVAGSFCAKFASGALVSMLLGQVPVFLQGPRHVMYFLCGLAAMWLTPGDAVYMWARKSRSLRLLLLMGGSLYRLRKAIYAVEVATGHTEYPLVGIRATLGGFPLALLTVVVVVDGNTLTRRYLLWAQKVFCNAASRRRFSKEYAGSDGQTPSALHLAELGTGIGCQIVGGARKTVAATIIPLCVTTAALWWSATDGWSENSLLEVRILLLGFFMWRSGAFREMASIHVASMCECI